MKIQNFKNMMAAMRGDVADYCHTGSPTIDEAEFLAWAEGMRAYYHFGKGYTNEKVFRETVERFVRDEILRVCA